MTNSKQKLLFFLKKKQYLTSDSILHAKSFFKNTSTNLLLKIHKRLLRILYYFVLSLKKIILKQSISNTIRILWFRCLEKNHSLPYNITCYKFFLSSYKKNFFTQLSYKQCLLLLVDNKYKSLVSLPKKKSHKTVLRSPHIDKRSREQFIKITRHSFLRLPTFFSSVSYILREIPSFGVEIRQQKIYLK